MTQCTTMAAPSSIEPYSLATSLTVDGPPVVLALIDEIDAIFASAAPAPVSQWPAPPAVGCALCGPRRAGRSYPHRQAAHSEPVQRIDPTQRSPPRQLKHP